MSAIKNKKINPLKILLIISISCLCVSLAIVFSIEFRFFKLDYLDQTLFLSTGWTSNERWKFFTRNLIQESVFLILASALLSCSLTFFYYLKKTPLSKFNTGELSKYFLISQSSLVIISIILTINFKSNAAKLTKKFKPINECVSYGSNKNFFQINHRNEYLRNFYYKNKAMLAAYYCVGLWAEVDFQKKLGTHKLEFNKYKISKYENRLELFKNEFQTGFESFVKKEYKQRFYSYDNPLHPSGEANKAQSIRHSDRFIKQIELKMLSLLGGVFLYLVTLILISTLYFQRNLITEWLKT